MHCQDAQELYSDYVEGKLDRAMTVSFENHLSDCASCQTEVEQFRSLWAGLEELPLAEPPAFFHENIMSRIALEQAKAEEASARKRLFWDWSALLRPRAFAAGFAALILLFAGAEVVQTQRASLGPVGWMFSLVHPLTSNTPLETQTAKWEAEGQNGGTLVVELKAKPQTNGQSGTANVQVMQGDTVLQSAVVTSSDSTTLRINLPKAPSSEEISLSVSEAGAEQNAKKVPLHLSNTP